MTSIVLNQNLKINADLCYIGWYDPCWIVDWPETLDSVHKVWLREDDQAVAEAEHVPHPGQVLVMAVLGVHPEVGRHDGGLAAVMAVVHWIDSCNNN